MRQHPVATAGRPKNGQTGRFVWRDDAVRYPKRLKELSENEPKRMGSGAP